MLRRNLTGTRLLILGLVGAVVFSIIAAIVTSSPSGSRTSIRDEGPGGARALSLWLKEIGYDVRELSDTAINPDDIDALFILNPRNDYSSEDAERVQAWVQDGHVLIAAGTTFRMSSILEPYDLSVSFMNSRPGRISLTSPTLIAPPFDNIEHGVIYAIDSDRRDLVMHLAYERQPVLVSFAEGQGIVWAAGTVYPFTNTGLNEEASARLILNMLASVPPPAVIGFDEGLHGLGEPPPSLSIWMRSTPAGLSILSTIVLTMTFLLMQGRRFGRPVPLEEERLRREPVEYIQAMANLLRRSGQREVTLRHYRNMLIRALSKRYAVDPGLSDDDLVRVITARDSSVDGDALRRLLAQLARNKVSEQELVKISMDVDAWIRSVNG